MASVKRKATSSIKQYQPKDCKIVKKETGHRDKNALKTTLMKARTNNERNTTCKDSDVILISDSNLDDQLKAIDNATTVDTMPCSQIPEFTYEDIMELIDYSDLNLFLDDYNALDDAVDDTGLIVRGATSTTTELISLAANVIDSSHTIPCKDLDGPLDLSTKNKKLQDLNLTSSKCGSNKSLRPQIVDSGNMARYRQYENPFAFAVSTTINDRNPCKECSSTMNRNSSTKVQTPTQSIMKQSLRYRDIIEEDFNSEVNRLIAKERRQAGPKPMSAVNFLADILGLYKLQPKYELKQIKGSLLQCRVWFDNHSGYGKGTSSKNARNSAASSLLGTLIHTRFFGNRIADLHDYCMTRKCRLPIYADVARVNATWSKNEEIFIQTCSFKQYKEFGQGRSKKIAKAFAALKMWLNVCRSQEKDMPNK